MATKVQGCSCKSEYQDKVYGQGMRLMNLTAGSDESKRKARCTVCGKEQEIRKG